MVNIGSVMYNSNQINNDDLSNSVRRGKLFRKLSNSNMRTKLQFQCDELGLTYMTHADIAEMICYNSVQIFGINTSKCIITDAFGGVGGNAIEFSKYFRFVNAIECDEARSNMLINNLNIHNVNNWAVYTGYYQQYMNKLIQDVIFFDPPWGDDYWTARKNNKLIRITIDESTPISIEDLVISQRRNAKFCIVKLPINYDEAYFDRCIWKYAEPMFTTYFPDPFASLIKYVEYRQPKDRRSY